MRCARPLLNRLRRFVTALVPVVLLLSLAAEARAQAPAPVSEAEIQEAIRRGVQYLLNTSSPQSAGESGLTAYTLLKSGMPPGDPRLTPFLASIRAKITDVGYAPRTHHIYEAAVDLMALEAADAKENADQIAVIARYLIEQQKPGGQWYYPHQQDTGGDTSITQYALLGLWAAHRAGVEVPVDVWERAARWLIATQRNDGGFLYHPGQPTTPTTANATHTMVAAGVGSLHLIRMLIQPGDAASAPISVPRASSDKKFSVLERFVPDEEPEAKPVAPVPAPVRVTKQQMDQSIQSGTAWLVRHWMPDAGRVYRSMYFFYGLERLGAIAQQTKFGPHDWYQYGAAHMVRTQTLNGSWSEPASTVAGTCFGVLFLVKATGSLVRPRAVTPKVGGGLLASGRGLPEDLTDVTLNAGKVEARKLQGPVDELLAVLEQAGDTDVQAAQASIVDAVQLEHPEELIAQKDRLARLVKDPRLEVRRTAVWALGRTKDIAMARLLVEALADPSLDVALEAHNALCVLSRQPAGLGLPPTPEQLPEQQRGDAAERNWRALVGAAWRQWYLQVRPYSERNDRFEVVPP